VKNFLALLATVILSAIAGIFCGILAAVFVGNRR